jgi:hypothetical protein
MSGKNSEGNCRSRDQYVWQLEKGGLMSAPLPDATDLARLSWQVAANDHFEAGVERRVTPAPPPRDARDLRRDRAALLAGSCDAG